MSNIKINGFNADELYKKTTDSQLTDLIKSNEKTIDDLIINNNENGLNRAEYQLPDTFTISLMEKKDIQLVLYTRLIEIYEARGFTVLISVANDITKIIIKWKNSINPDEKRKLLRIFNSHLVKPAGSKYH